MKLIATAVAAALASVLACSSASAQDASNWPQKPVKWLVPFAPGGNTDLIARTLAEPLSKKLGQPIVVENRPGAGGTLATSEVAVAEPDGYTMQIGDISTHAISPLIYADLTYDAVAGFKPVIQITSVPLLLVVNPEVPAKTVGELVEMAKADPESLSFASSGIGSPQHLAFEYFKSAAGFEAVHIPYNGAAPALTDVVAGHVQTMIDGTAVPRVKDGTLRALAVTGRERSPILPDVPTMQEAGVPNYEFTSWHGVFFPAGVPDEIVEKTNAALGEILKDEAIQKRFSDLNIGIAGGSPQEFADFIAAESTKMKTLVEASGAKQE